MGEIKVSSHNLGRLLADSTDTPGPLLPGRLLRARRTPPGPTGHGDRGAAPPGGGRGATRVHGRGPGRARGDPDRRVVRTADPCHLGRRRRAWPGLVGTSGRRAKGAGRAPPHPTLHPSGLRAANDMSGPTNVRSPSVHHGTAPQPRRGQSARRGVPGRTYPPVSQCAAAAPDRPVVQFLQPDTPSTPCRGCSRVRLTCCAVGSRCPLLVGLVLVPLAADLRLDGSSAAPVRSRGPDSAALYVVSLSRAWAKRYAATAQESSSYRLRRRQQ